MIKAEIKSENLATSDKYTVGQTIEVWDGEEEDWYRATIDKIEKNRLFVNYVGQGSSNNEWVDEEDVCIRDRNNSSDENGYAIGHKVKVWDDDEEWYSAIIGNIQNQQYLVQYIGYDSSYDEWVDIEDIC